MKEVGSSDTTFSIVLEARNTGHRIARTKWEISGDYIQFDQLEEKYALFFRYRHIPDGYGFAWYYPTWEDLLADDWKILD